MTTRRRFFIIFNSVFFITIISIGRCTSQAVPQDHFAQNGEVSIHYVTMGKGPAIVFVHGFPDYWYTWRHQMKALSATNKVIAVDLRGYNLSDAPQGVEHYVYSRLVEDLVAVIKSNGEDPVFLVGHDWGAALCWRLAIHYPELVRKLVIMSVPHPRAGDRNAKPLDEREPTYADRFVTPEFLEQLNEQWMAGWVTDPQAKEKYIEAFKRSDKQAMINYYKANFPTLKNLKDPEFQNRAKAILPNLKMPVLIIHGKKDPYLPVSGHNNTWDFVDRELTIKILPDAGHFVQQDASETVTALLKEFIIP